MCSPNPNPPKKRQKLTSQCDLDFVLQLSKLQKTFHSTLTDFSDLSKTKIHQSGIISSPYEDKDKSRKSKKNSLLLQYGTDVNVQMGSSSDENTNLNTCFLHEVMNMMSQDENQEEDYNQNDPGQETLNHLHLLMEGIDVNTTAIRNPLHEAIFKGQEGLVQEIVTKEDFQLDDQCVQLAFQCLLTLLTSDGAEVNCSKDRREKDCPFALHKAEIKSRLLIIELLMRFGSDTNRNSCSRSGVNLNPLLHQHITEIEDIEDIRNNCTRDDEVISMLLSSGSGVNSLVDKYRRSPLHSYCKRSLPHYLTDLLLLNGDNVNCIKCTNSKLLHEVCFN